MRIIIKGGVWKNTEDEVLKAAVMKYGKNQWARIASLLNRKSPKQCKARWYEWLDPSIKKTDWSKEEDEKLLHLAKLMPTQWRTIAPIVGRTPAQCLERYQQLLDDAEQKEAEAEGIVAPSAEDVRRLRPGEIDPDPETKPARPDPIDMDEDEKEMLSEARARLANTQGKKAKRKARERQLEEARRLAFVQKRREMKAAGIDLKIRRKKGEFDYNREVPFEIKPAPGFFDTSEERDREVKFDFKGKLISELNPKTRFDRDTEKRKADEKRRKEAQEKGLHKNVMLELPEPEFLVKRRKLDLPAPQIAQKEVEELVKFGHSSGQAIRSAVEDSEVEFSRDLVEEEKNSIQRQLTARTTQVHAMKTPLLSETISTEAANLLALTKSQTPLLGGENIELREGGTGFQGLTPVRPTSETPSHAHGNHWSRETPKHYGGETPLRDSFHADEKAESTFGKQPFGEEQPSLEFAFANLPKPKNDYEIVLPEIEEEVEELTATKRPNTAIVMDAGEVERLARVKEMEKQASLKQLKSSVLSRNFPRPISLDGYFRSAAAKNSVDENDAISKLVNEELRHLIVRELLEYPPDDVSPQTLAALSQPPVDISSELLVLSKNVIEDEMALMEKKDLMNEINGTTSNTFLLQKGNEKVPLVYEPESSFTKGALSAARKEHAILSYQIYYDALAETAEQSSEQQSKVQSALKTPMAKAQALRKQFLEVQEEIVNSQMDLLNYENLLRQEEHVILPERFTRIDQELKIVQQREQAGQEMYGSLVV